MMITNLNHTSDYNTEKVRRCLDYIDALEEERRKIQVFQRELPLCLELVTQAIEACKQQITSSETEYNFHGQSECSEQTSNEGPILEEFIPLKRASSSDDDEEEEEEQQQCKKTKKNNDNNNNGDFIVEKDISKNNDNKASKKSDWLRSVQLWNQTSDPEPKEDLPKEVPVMEVKRNGTGGAFQPFKREKIVGTSNTSAPEVQADGGGTVAAAAAAPSSSVETGGSSGGGNKKEEKESQSQRKQRRCWSPELHRRFLQALQQLGGSHVATPKQIRELMKVDGLTNDEVKSHLQKYRLHTRRPTPSVHNNSTTTRQAPQFVVVGGIWVPPAEYAGMAAPNVQNEASRGAIPKGIYAPIAAPPQTTNAQDASMPLKQTRQQKQLHSDEQRGSHSEGGGVHSNSPACSSSDTTTTSPPISKN